MNESISQFIDFVDPWDPELIKQYMDVPNNV